MFEHRNIHQFCYSLATQRIGIIHWEGSKTQNQKISCAAKRRNLSSGFLFVLILVTTAIVFIERFMDKKQWLVKRSKQV